MVTIDGVAFSVSTGYADGPNGIGSFTLLAGQTLTISFNNEQLYVSVMEVHAVPEPGMLSLLGAWVAWDGHIQTQEKASNRLRISAPID